MNTFTINGEKFSEERLIKALQDQISRMPEYSHFNDAVIEFCSQNNAGDVFFYVSNDNGEDMMIKVTQRGKVYWDWTGPVMDD